MPDLDKAIEAKKYLIAIGMNEKQPRIHPSPNNNGTLYLNPITLILLHLQL